MFKFVFCIIKSPFSIYEIIIRTNMLHKNIKFVNAFFCVLKFKSDNCTSIDGICRVNTKAFEFFIYWNRCNCWL